MTLSKALLLVALAGLSVTTGLSKDLQWDGITWHVRAGHGKPCATSLWSDRGAWVDSSGALHLKLERGPAGTYACVELDSVSPVGFGRYRFDVSGPLGAIDPHVVFAMFLYPPPAVGPDGTHEIDIEAARWGVAGAPQLNYTVWNRSSPGKRHLSFQVPSNLSRATFDLDWSPDDVRFASSARPKELVDFTKDIAEKPETLILSLWLYGAQAPQGSQDVEFVVHSMRVR